MSDKPMHPWHEDFDALLFDYASSALDEASALLAAAWIQLSPQARQVFLRYESLGGSLMCEGCTPSEMNKGSLVSVLDRLEDKQYEKNYSVKVCFEREWQPLYQGVQMRSVIGTAKPVMLVKASPGVSHLCGAHERILVVEGSVLTQERTHHRRGDIMIANRTVLSADETYGAVMLVMQRPSWKDRLRLYFKII